ncbi:hypothetical protein CPB83DRAFT_865076 [Crepidotus variabilis]|uniref:C2H2-type domain-containing protein n=1 Tax=Crepidotus variabilis TaxID=179855 RepID=A0A9P6E3V4_9AGAR|nr:hypothetical protein CPB83DRAFT_865076 [Crepidotus variabilis]
MSRANAKNQANRFVCKSCDVSFTSQLALGSHLRSPRHAGRNPSAARKSSGIKQKSGIVKASKHHECSDCSRDFKSHSALKQHQASPIHDGRNFKCPFCNRKYKSPSAVALHLESGYHKIITRHHVTSAVHAMNIIPNLSIKRITGTLSPPTVRTYIASAASFDGTAYKCYLCPKTFRTLSALNGHLNSPAHDDDEFRCPKCKRTFKLISGFVQHLESRCCGLAEVGQVNNYFIDMTAQFSRLLKM